MEKAIEKGEKALWLSYSKGLKLSHPGLGNSVAMRERVINSADFNLLEVILSSPLILAVGELWLSVLPPDKGSLRSGWQVETAAKLLHVLEGVCWRPASLVSTVDKR